MDCKVHEVSNSQTPRATFTPHTQSIIHAASTSCEMQGWMNQIGIKIARRNINTFRYAEDTTLMAEREEDINPRPFHFNV